VNSATGLLMRSAFAGDKPMETLAASAARAIRAVLASVAGVAGSIWEAPEVTPGPKHADRSPIMKPATQLTGNCGDK
jgi:hypothetical protein